ncbi:MAG: hypothetical protein JWM33_40 [Caulobacteraceae bacterium]|nr:hypothetical protein [Caulobacteraceae bacterium]
MGRAGRLVSVLAMLAVAPAVTAAPAADPAMPDSMRRALLGPIEDVPTAWGAPAMPASEETFAAPIATPSSSISSASVPASGAAPTARDQALAALEPQRQAAPPPPAPRAADQVGGLVVTARRIRPSEQTVEKCVTGPAWWRATKGSATLWIMGTPDQMPLTTTWDDTCMRKRMVAAHATVVPAVPPTAVADPFARANTALRQTTAPLSQRLPPPLWAQLSRRIDGNAIRAQSDAQWARSSDVQFNPVGITSGTGIGGLSKGPRGITGQGMAQALALPPPIHHIPRTTLQVLQDTPNLYAPTLVVTQRLALSLDLPGKLGNPAALKAMQIAAAGNMLIGRTPNSEAQFALLTNFTAPSEADQQACLKKVLDEMDAGHDGRGNLQRVQAWAVGDLDHALLRMNVLNTCPFGEVSRRFWSALVNQYMQLIDRNTRQGGITVAVVEFDPLLLKNGVLSRLKAEGFKIATPEDLQ